MSLCVCSSLSIYLCLFTYLQVLCFCTNDRRIKDNSSLPEVMSYSCFSLSPPPPLPSHQVVVAPQRKKLLSLYAVAGDRLQHVRDYPLADQAVAMVTTLAL